MNNADRSTLTDAQITAGADILCDCPNPKRIGRNSAIDVYHAMVPHQGATSVHVGDSKFESWFSEKDMAGIGTKQLCRDAYAAGMRDPVVAPQQVDAVKAPTDEQLQPLWDAAWSSNGDIRSAVMSFGRKAFALASPSPAVPTQPTEAKKLGIYYMRDNHTFRSLSDDPETALSQIIEELDAGHTSGMLCTKRPSAPKVVHFDYRDRAGSLARAKIYLDATAAQPTDTTAVIEAQRIAQSNETPAITTARLAMEAAKAKADARPYGTPGWKALERAYGDSIIAYGKAVESRDWRPVDNDPLSNISPQAVGALRDDYNDNLRAALNSPPKPTDTTAGE